MAVKSEADFIPKSGAAERFSKWGGGQIVEVTNGMIAPRDSTDQNRCDSTSCHACMVQGVSNGDVAPKKLGVFVKM